MSDSVGRIDLDLGVNYRAFNRQLNGIAGNAQTMASGAFKKLGMVIAAAFAVKKLVDFGNAAIKLASDLEEVQNVVDVTFGEMNKEINAFSKNALHQFGLSELSAKRFSSTMGAMLKSSGLSGRQMIEMSKSLTALTGDMASFYNLEHEQAFQKIRSGISGETEPLKQLGINMSVANLEAYALSKGIKKSFQAMSQAEQILLRYNYLMHVTKDAQGDFARTSDSWANQTRILSEQWKIFMGVMGSGFINILTPAIKMLNTLIQKLIIAAQYFKAFTELIFGVKNQVAQGAASVANAAASMDDMSDATDGVGKSAKKAGKAIKGSVASFDQLNILTQNTASAMDDIASGAAGMGGMDFEEIDTSGAEVEIDIKKFDPLINKLNMIKDLASDVGKFLKDAFGPSIASAIGKIIPVLKEWKNALKSTFEDFMTLSEPLKNWFITDLVPFWQYGIEVAGNVLAGLLDTMLLIFNSMRAAIFPIISWFVTDGLPLLTDFGMGAIRVFQEIFDVAKYIFDTLWKEVVDPVLKLISKITLNTLQMIKGFWDKFGKDIVRGLVETVDSIKSLFESLWKNFLGPIVSHMLEELNWLWDKHLKGVIQEVLNFVGILVTAAMDILNKFIVPIVNYLIKQLGPTFSNIINGIVSALGTFLAMALDVVKGVIKALGGLVEFIAGVFTGDWRRAWQGVKDVFVGIMQSIAGVFKGIINSFIDATNFLIRSLNSKLKLEVPDWVPLIGGKKWSFNVPQIPKLANGGIVTQPTLAMMGENNKKEAVIPLENSSFITDFAAAIAQAVATALAGMNNGGKSSDYPETLVLKVGETEFGRIAIKSINSWQRQTGTVQIVI